MKRNLIGTLSLVALSVLLTASGAFAQGPVKADVPFAFTAWNAQLPAGCYTITPQLSATIMIRNCKTGAVRYSSVQRGYPRNNSPKLVFHRFGDQYFLTEVRGVSDAMGMTLPKSKLEKELQLAQGSSNASEETVIAHK
jgi:hypothetical protein